MNIGATVTVDRIRRVFLLTSVAIVLGLMACAVAGFGIRLVDWVIFLALMTFVYWRITRCALTPVVDRRVRQRQIAPHLDRRARIVG